VITNADIAHARATRYAGPAVGLAFTKTGANMLCDITTANIGKTMGVLVDGKLVNVATIRERLTCGRGGRALITGNFSHDEAKRIAATFPSEPADPLKINSVWQGTGPQSKPALTYLMILFVQQQMG
jgi:preprotein translocase subunit SecD